LIRLSPHAPTKERSRLLRLASLGWWDYPEIRADWSRCVDGLFDPTAKVGSFAHFRHRIRGRGYWREGDRVVLHLGDRVLLPDGETVPPNAYRADDRGDDADELEDGPTDEGTAVYHPMPAIEGPAGRPLGRRASRRILGSYNQVTHDELSGHLLAGWTVLAPVSGALDRRSHVWIVGGSATDRADVLSTLVQPLLGGTSMWTGGATEAEIRAALGGDAFGVIYEAGSWLDEKTMRGVVDLARSAAREDYECPDNRRLVVRSMFLLASTHGRACNHISLVKLRRPLPELQTLDPTMPGRLVARTLEWLRDGRLDATMRACVAACSGALNGAGCAYSLGPLIAGAWTLKGDDVPATDEVRQWLDSGGVGSLFSTASPGTEILEQLLLRRVRVGNRKPRIGELVAMGLEKVQRTGIRPEEAERTLRERGLRVRNGDVWVANRSVWIREKLEGTEYESGWSRHLKELPGARPTANAVRFGSSTSRAVRVPLDGLGFV